MSEVVVVLGVAETVQGDVLKERLDVRDVKGMGLSAFGTGRYQNTLREGNKYQGFNSLYLCISKELMKIIV